MDFFKRNKYNFDINQTKSFVENIKSKINEGNALSSINLNEIIKSYDNLDKSVVKAAQDAQASGSGFDTISSSLESAEASATRAQNKMSKFGTVLKTVGASLANTAITWGVLAAINVAVDGITGLINHSKNLTQSASSYNEELKNSSSTLNSYREQVEQLNEVINNPSSSIEEITSARENLLSIQNEMIDTYGNETEVMDIFTASINSQADTWNNLAKSQYEQIRSELNTDEENNHWWDKFSRWINGYESASDELISKMSGDSGTVRSIDLETISNYREFNDVYSDLVDTFVEAHHLNFNPSDNRAYGNIYDLKDAYEDAIDKIKYYQKLSNDPDNIYFTDTLSELQNALDEISSTISSSSEFYNQYVLDEILSNSKLQQSYEDLTQAKKEYTEASSKNDTSGMENAIKKFSNLQKNILSSTSDDREIQRYFEDLFPDMNSVLNKFNFENDIENNIDGLLSNLKTIGKTFDDLSISEIKNYDVTISKNNALKASYDKLRTIASKYKLNLNQVIDKMQDLGIIQSDAYKQLVKYFGSENIKKLSDDELEYAYSIKNVGEMTFDQLKNRIKDLQTLASNEIDIKARTNLDVYTEAAKNGDHIDDYNSYVEMMKKVQELYEAGQVGSEIFKAGAKAFSMNGMTDASNWVENYKELGKYFTEGSTGLETFVKNLESNKIAEWDEATKTWAIDLTDFAGVAKKMNMPVEMLSVLMEGLQQYGFTDDYFGTMADGTEHLTDLTQQLIEERAKLSQMSPDENAYDEQQEIVSSLQERIKKTAKSLSDFYKDDGAAEKAYQDKLKERDDVLSDLQTAYKNVFKASGKARDEALEALEPVIEAVESEYGIKIRVDEEGNFHILDDLDTINQKIADTEQKIQQLKQDNGGKLNMDDEEVQQTLSEYEQLLRDKQLLEVPTIMRLDTSSLSEDAANTVNKVSDIIELLEEKDIQLKVNPDADVSDIQKKIDKQISNLSDEDKEVLFKLGFDTQGKSWEDIIRSTMNTDSITIPAELTLDGDNPILAAVDETNRYLNAIAIKIGADTSDFDQEVDEAVESTNQRRARIQLYTKEGSEDGSIFSDDQLVSSENTKQVKIKAEVTNENDIDNLIKQLKNLPEGTTDVKFDVDASSEELTEKVKKAIEDAANDKENLKANLHFDYDIDTTHIMTSTWNQYKDLNQGEVSINANITGKDDINELRKQLNELPEGTQNVTIDASVQNEEQLEQVQQLLDEFSTEDYNIGGSIALYGVDEATGKAIKLKEAIYKIPGSANTTVNANIANALSSIGSVEYELNRLNGKTATVTVTTVKQTANGNVYSVKSGGKDVPSILERDYQTQTNANGTFHSPAHATGTNVAIKHDEKAVVNEIGNEGLVRDGVLHEIQGGAQTINLKRGDIIFNHKQLQELKENGYVTSNGGRGKVVGAAFAKGSVNGLPAHSGEGSSNGKTPAKYNWSNTSTNTSTSSSGTKSGTSSSSSSSSGSSNSSSSSDDKPQKTDYIEILISRIERAINNLSTVATSVFRKLSDRLSSTNNELAEINREMSVQQQGYDRYIQEANSIGLSEDIASKIRDGAIDISEYDSDTSEKIQEYQSWWIFMPRINLFYCGDIPIILSRYNIIGNDKCECGTSL